LVGSGEQSSSNLPSEWTRMIPNGFTGKKSFGSSNCAKRQLLTLFIFSLNVSCQPLLDIDK